MLRKKRFLKEELDMGDKLYTKLLERIREIEIIDTHEHIMRQEDARKERLHLFRVFEYSYARLDFVTAGMPPEVWERNNPREIWAVWRGFQEQVGLTHFFKNVIRALQDLYGLEGNRITEDNWPELSAKIVKAYERKDWYEYVLSKRAKVRISFLDNFWSVESFPFNPAIFVPVLRTNPLILGRGFVSQYPKGKFTPTLVEALADDLEISLADFESYLMLIDTAIHRYKDHGAPAVKIGTAYERSLFFESVSRDEAARLYARTPTELSTNEQKKLQDFMAHYVIQKATQEDLPVQIHTGILARNANTLANSNPENLNNLFLQYPETKFVLLHLSFPYIRQAFSLSKMFPNVFLDFCWVPMLSEKVAAQALDEFLDLVPYSKLMWGGDSFRVEGAYAAACVTREVMASVLAERVKKGDMDLEMAVRVSEAILHGNARDLFEGLRRG